MRAVGTFEVSLSSQPPDDRPEGAFLGRLAIAKAFAGDLEATSVGQMLAARGERPESAGYVAIEQVSGVLAGRRGTFILQHSGHSSPAGQALEITVIADSGTGELAGLAGSMKIINDAGQHSYEFEFTLNP